MSRPARKLDPPEEAPQCPTAAETAETSSPPSARGSTMADAPDVSPPPPNATTNPPPSNAGPRAILPDRAGEKPLPPSLENLLPIPATRGIARGALIGAYGTLTMLEGDTLPPVALRVIAAELVDLGYAHESECVFALARRIERIA